MNDNSDYINELSEDEREQLKQRMIEAGWDKLSREELLEEISRTLDDLVRSGQVERLIGEDGHFYYRSKKN